MQTAFWIQMPVSCHPHTHYLIHDCICSNDVVAVRPKTCQRCRRIWFDFQDMPNVLIGPVKAAETCLLPASPGHPTHYWAWLRSPAAPAFCCCRFLQAFPHSFSVDSLECHCLFNLEPLIEKIKSKKDSSPALCPGTDWYAVILRTTFHQHINVEITL